MNSVLLLFGHPAFHKSIVNKFLLDVAKRTPGVTVRNLYDLYPDFIIDVRAEQEQLLQHKSIILQHPLFWYSTPAIFKEYFDLVLEYDFAYGPNGTHLSGKRWMHCLTVGGSRDSYTPIGEKQMTLCELLAPMRLTSKLCGMDFLPPFVIYSSLRETTQQDLMRLAPWYQKILTRLQEPEDRLSDLAHDHEIDALSLMQESLP